MDDRLWRSKFTSLFSRNNNNNNSAELYILSSVGGYPCFGVEALERMSGCGKGVSW